MCLRLSGSANALSVLVPGQRELRYRACLGRQKPHLLEWFSSVEARAWKYVNTFFPEQRPKMIFLVTGQTLTDEYYIYHQETDESHCDVALEPRFGVPQVLNVNAILGYQFERVSASMGFNVVMPPSQTNPMLYSVYFELFESKPMTHLRFETTFALRVNDMFR
jgi:hypothetical protein